MPGVGNTIIISVCIWYATDIIVALVQRSNEPRHVCLDCRSARRRQPEYRSRSLEHCDAREPHVHELQVGEQCGVLLRRFDHDGEHVLRGQSIPPGLERDYVWVGEDEDVQMDGQARQIVREMEREVREMEKEMKREVQEMERQARQIGREVWMGLNGGF